jgi:hypothetical protein
MKLFDSLIGVSAAVDWLKEELHVRGVEVWITATCLRELATDAEAAAKSPTSTLNAHMPYGRRLRDEIALRAEFLRTWTLSDEQIDSDSFSQRLAGLARKYALPRPWRVPESVAHAARHPTPTYLNWASI